MGGRPQPASWSVARLPVYLFMMALEELLVQFLLHLLLGFLLVSEFLLAKPPLSLGSRPLGSEAYFRR